MVSLSREHAACMKYSLCHAQNLFSLVYETITTIIYIQRPFSEKSSSAYSMTFCSWFGRNGLTTIFYLGYFALFICSSCLTLYICLIWFPHHWFLFNCNVLENSSLSASLLLLNSFSGLFSYTRLSFCMFFFNVKLPVALFSGGLIKILVFSGWRPRHVVFLGAAFEYNLIVFKITSEWTKSA